MLSNDGLVKWMDEVEERWRTNPPIGPEEMAANAAVLNALLALTDPVVALDYSPLTLNPQKLWDAALINWNMKIDSPLVDRLMGKAPADAVDDMAAWYEQNGWRF